VAVPEDCALMTFLSFERTETTEELLDSTLGTVVQSGSPKSRTSDDATPGGSAELNRPSARRAGECYS
jgi:hypothetical protein